MVIALDRNLDTLPESRLCSDKGAVMSDFVLPDGTRIRCEWIPVFCAHCGVPKGFVPKENTTWACYLCDPCAEQHGALLGTYMVPDHEYWNTVEQEMLDKHGRALTSPEIAFLHERGCLGSALEKLMRESPVQISQ